MKNGLRYARLSAAIAAVIYGATPAHGLTLTWDPSGAAIPADGSGNWDNSSLQWFDPGSNSVVAWSNTNPDSAVPHIVTAYNFNVDPNDPTQAPGTIHRGGANVLYGDGHVEWHIQKDLILYKPATATNALIHFSPGSNSWNSISPQWNNDFLP